jgi:hypothetical protein
VRMPLRMPIRLATFAWIRRKKAAVPVHHHGEQQVNSSREFLGAHNWPSQGGRATI